MFGTLGTQLLPIFLHQNQTDVIMITVLVRVILYLNMSPNTSRTDAQC